MLINVNEIIQDLIDTGLSREEAFEQARIELQKRKECRSDNAVKYENEHQIKTASMRLDWRNKR